MPWIRVLLVTLVCSLGTGCFWWNYGQFDPLQKGDDFDQARKRFTRMIRWGQIDRASQYVLQEEREEFFEAAKVLRGVRFTDYEVLSVEVKDRLNTATVHVMFRGYAISQPLEKSVSVKQEWQRVGDSWRVSPQIAQISGTFDGRLGMRAP